MKQWLRQTISILCLMGLLCPAVTLAANKQTASKTTEVLASIYPLQLIAGLIGQSAHVTGAALKVSTLLPAGSTPHDYSLKPSDIRRVLDADIVLWMGPDIEPYLAAIVARVDQQKVIDVSALPGLHRLPLRSLVEEDDEHDHHDEHHHDTDFDPHVWWSVENAEVIVAALHPLIRGVTTSEQGELGAIERLFSGIKEKLAVRKKAAKAQLPSFIVFHDGLQYLEHDIGVSSKARVVLSDDHQPGIRTLLTLKQRVQAESVQCIVAEPMSNLSIIGKIEGDQPLTRVMIDTLGWGSGSYVDMLSAAYDAILHCGTPSTKVN